MASPLPKSYLIKRESYIAILTDYIVESDGDSSTLGMDQYVMELRERKLRWKHCAVSLGLTVEHEMETDGDQEIPGG